MTAHLLTLPIHPLTGLRALGVIGGRPVWPILGGSEPAPEGAPPAVPTAGTGTEAPAATGTAPAAGAPAVVSDEPQDGEGAEAFLARVGPLGVAKLALKYRGEAGDRRIALNAAQSTAEQERTAAADAARQKVLDDLKPGLVALGLIKADEQPDPAKLTTDLEQQRTEARTLQVENAVLRAGQTLGIDADRLLDSRKFADTVAKLDPSATDFGGSIEAAMKAAAEKDATLKTTRAVAAAGLPHLGGSGGQTGQVKAVPLADAVAAAMNPTR